MTPEGQPEVVRTECEQAAQAFRAAEALHQMGLTRDAFSRLYFASVHLMGTLLASAGIEARSHRGLHSLIGLHFVKTGRLEPRHQQTFARLETWRDAADYDRGFAADPALLDAELKACA